MHLCQGTGREEKAPTSRPQPESWLWKCLARTQLLEGDAKSFDGNTTTRNPKLSPGSHSARHLPSRRSQRHNLKANTCRSYTCGCSVGCSIAFNVASNVWCFVSKWVPHCCAAGWIGSCHSALQRAGGACPPDISISAPCLGCLSASPLRRARGL